VNESLLRPGDNELQIIQTMGSCISVLFADPTIIIEPTKGCLTVHSGPKYKQSALGVFVDFSAVDQCTVAGPGAELTTLSAFIGLFVLIATVSGFE